MKRIPSLDGLRAISIAPVILSHLLQTTGIAAHAVQSYGKLGVHVFFVQSGFLITGLLLHEHDRSSTINLSQFYVRRAFRLLPAAFVFLAIAVCPYWREIRWIHVVTAVFYVANMDMWRPWVFDHLWSLGIEEQFYLFWPLALRKWHQYPVPILVGVFFAAPVFRTFLYAAGIEGPMVASLPVLADQLASGCLLAVGFDRLPGIPGRVALAMAAVAIVFPWYQATTAVRTVIMLFLLRPVLNVCIAGSVLHVHPESLLGAELASSSRFRKDQL